MALEILDAIHKKDVFSISLYDKVFDSIDKNKTMKISKD